MTNVKVIIIHGIGNEKMGYANELVAGVRKEFDWQLKNILATQDDYSREIQFREVVWEEILSENQAKLKDILRKSQEPIATPKNFIEAIRCFLKGSYQKFRSDFVTEAICDILGYKNKEVYTGIHQKISQGIKVLSQAGNGDEITFVSHSLGTVIGSDFVYDIQEKQTPTQRNFKVANFFTLGSPLALFSLHYGKGGLFKPPVKMEADGGKWVNFVGKEDPIAYELKILNADYNSAVLKDLKMQFGMLGIAHLMYWGNKDVHTIIGRKLAIDWLRLNKRLEAGATEKLYKNYAESLERGQ